MAAGDGVHTTGMTWRAYDCLYAGWQNLLTGPETLTADTAKWRAYWHSDGDVAVRDPWPAFNDDPSAVAASAYRTTDTPVAYAATAGTDQPLGCDLADLPPTRDNWPSLTVDSFVVPPSDPITDDTPPTVKPAFDGLYHGGPVDFARTPDVGAFLRDFQQKTQLGPRVVLLLPGDGEHPITPFRLQGCTLVLHADQQPEGTAPLTLLWDGLASVGQEGLIEIENGGLEMINVNVKLADFPRAATPAYLLKARGDLRLFRCRLEGPQQSISDAYRGVISLQGSGDPAVNAACAATINESVLLSGRDGIQVRGVGARLLLRQTVLVAAGDALHLDPGPNGASQANVQCVLERSTLAARRAIVHLEDAARPADGPPADPLVVRSRECAFLDPFGDKTGPAGMLALEMSALAHGLLVWLGVGEAFGKRLTFAGAPAAAPLDKEEGRPAWARLWGSYGDRHPAADAPALVKPFDAAPWPLERLALPKPTGADKRPAGADLTQLRPGEEARQTAVDTAWISPQRHGEHQEETISRTLGASRRACPGGINPPARRFLNGFSLGVLCVFVVKKRHAFRHPGRPSRRPGHGRRPRRLGTARASGLRRGGRPGRGAGGPGRRGSDRRRRPRDAPRPAPPRLAVRTPRPLCIPT